MPFDPRLAIQARQAQGLPITPDQARLLEEQATPQEQAGMTAQMMQGLLLEAQPTPQESFLQQASPPVAQLGATTPRIPIPGGLEAETSAAVVADSFLTPTERARVQTERAADEARAALAVIPGESAGDMDVHPGRPDVSTQQGQVGGAERIRGRDPLTGDIRPTEDPAQGGTLGDVSVTRGPGGELIIQAPGADPVVIAGTAEEQAAALGRAMSQSLREGSQVGEPTMRGGADPLLPPAAVAQAIEQAPPFVRGGGTGEPRTELEMRASRSIAGQVSPQTAAQLQVDSERVRQAQARHDLGSRVVAAGHEASLAELGAQQMAQAAAQEEAANARAQHMEEALGSFQRQAREVAQRTVDPNQFFGGFGGRMGAAIAVALGEAGRALTGDTQNRALDIINTAVERNINAQESNLANARAGVAAEGQALGMMRSIFSDRDAATNAARALHLQGIATQLDGVMAGLNGNQLANAQALRNAVQAQMQTAAQAAQEREAGAISVRSDFSIRGPQSAVQAGAERFLSDTRGLGVSGGGSPQAAPQSREEALSPMGQSIMDEVRANMAGTPEGDRLTQLESRAAEAEARGRHGPARQARRGVTTALGQRVQRRVQQRIAPTISPSDWAEANEATLERARALGNIQAGFRPAPGHVRWEDTYLAATSSPAGRERLAGLMSDLSLWDRWVPEIVRISAEYNAELTRGEPDVARAIAMRGHLLRVIRHRFTGVAVNEAEMEEWASDLPEVGRIRESVTDAWDSMQNTWSAMYETIMTAQRTALQSEFALTTDRVGVNPRSVDRLMAASRMRKIGAALRGIREITDQAR